MKRSTRFNRLLATALAVAAWPLAQVAAAGPAEPMVPIDIAVPAGHKLYLVGHAVGVQIHRCDAVVGRLQMGVRRRRAPSCTTTTASCSLPTSAGRAGRPGTAARSSAASTVA